MLERAARPTEARPTLPREASRQPGAAKEVRGAPDRWWTWGGGARRTTAHSRVWALGAPRNHHNKGINGRMVVEWERAAYRLALRLRAPAPPPQGAGAKWDARR